MIDWATVEAAVRTWVINSVAGQLAADRVVMADQNLHLSEDQPRITIRVGDLTHVGGPDAYTKSFNVGDVGQEVTTTTMGMRELVVSLQAYAPVKVNDSPKMIARNLMTLCQANLGLPAVRSSLNAAGLGVLQEGNVQRIPTVKGVTYEDRANLDVRMCLSVSVTSKTGYIDRVTGTVALNGGAPLLFETKDPSQNPG